MRKLGLIIIFILFVSAVMLCVPWDVQASTTVSFSSNTYDGRLDANDPTYSVAQTAMTGSLHSGVLFVGQAYSVLASSVYRSYVFFDTSALPDDATIDSAYLSLYVLADVSDDDFNVTIQNGQPTYPHTPLQSGDFYYQWYSGDGGALNTSEISGVGYWNITLSTTGESWISLDGTTKLCLRSDNDINAVAPSGDEYVRFSTNEEGYAAKLYVTYSVSQATTYIIHGPFNEDGSVYNGYLNVTLHKTYEQSVTYVLDGTGGVEDNETIGLDQPASFFSWNITAYNYSRSYYLLGDSFEELWLFVPSTEEPAYNYLFTITDFYGMINPFLQTTINVEGVQRIVERRSLATTDSVTFLLTQWHRYGLTFICDQGTYSQEFLAESVFSTNLVVLAGAFPTTDASIGIAATATRTNDTTITVTYADNKEMTISLYMEITHRSGATDILDYSSTTTGSSQTLTWTDAVAEWDYNVYLEAYRSDNTYIWDLQAPSLSTTSNPFSGLLSALGTWPAGFNADQIPAAIIIVGVLAIFSVWSSTAGIALALIVAGVLGVLGFFVISASNLVFAGFVAIMAHIGETKKTEREV